MLFVGTSIIHPSTEGVFLLCNILDLLIYSLKVIQSIMGHRNIETTMDIYAEATEEKKQESFENLATKLDVF